jgi:chromosome segregation ATPase
MSQKEHLAGLENEIVSLKSENSVLQTSFIDKQALLTQLKSTHETKLAEMETQRVVLEGLKVTLADLETRVKELGEEKSVLTNEVQETRRLLSVKTVEEKTTLVQHANVVKSLESELESMKNKVCELESKLALKAEEQATQVVERNVSVEEISSSSKTDTVVSSSKEGLRSRRSRKSIKKESAANGGGVGNGRDEKEGLRDTKARGPSMFVQVIFHHLFFQTI